MMCGMCESHINDVGRKTARVNKVTSSHTKGETVIVSEQPVDVEALKAAIAETGYTVTGVQTRPYEKKGFFSFLKKLQPGVSGRADHAKQEVSRYEDLGVRRRRSGLSAGPQSGTEQEKCGHPAGPGRVVGGH